MEANYPTDLSDKQWQAISRLIPPVKPGGRPRTVNMRVSRQFVKATAKQLHELSQRRFVGVRFVAIFIDSLDFAGEALVCALGLCDDGTKHVLGLRQGATENKEVVTGRLARYQRPGDFIGD